VNPQSANHYAKSVPDFQIFLLHPVAFRPITVMFFYLHQGVSPMHALTPVLLLICSNVFMTFAWYGHLKFKSTALWVVILVSWGIAFFEYCLQVPANRIGHEYYSAAQLKGLQEIITLAVFALFSIYYLGENLRWNHIAGFVLLVIAGFLIFKK